MARVVGHGASPALPTTPTSLKRIATRSTILHNDPPPVAAVKRKLLLTAIDKPPRLRNDLDIVVITQYLMSLESLATLSPQTLHYLATECGSMSLRDGDVFCYQEDPVDLNSAALVIIEGSLCGYTNKPFTQRADPNESFPDWNARQNRRRGVLVDFGDIQATYATGALCGFDDLLVPYTSTVESAVWSRRKGVHAQEQTRAIAFKKDTLDRAAHRFGLAYERSSLHSQRESASTDVSHLAIFTPFSEAAKQALFNSTPRRLVPCGDTLFASGDDTSTLSAFVLVLSGRLDIFWSGADASDESTTYTSTSASIQLEFKRTPIYSIRRGQSIGEQVLGLALDELFSSAEQPCTGKVSSIHQTPANRLPIRIVSGDDATEVMVLTRSLYYEKRTEDHTVLSYSVQLAHQRAMARLPSTVASSDGATTGSSPSILLDWAIQFFSEKAPVDRDVRDLQQLLWRLASDSVARKALFQLPPTVLERIAHAMELIHCPTPSLLVEDGAEVDEVYVVIHGALRVGSPGDTGSQHLYLPGDLYGVHDSKSPLYADAASMLLTIPRQCIDRWLAPVKATLVVIAGSLFDRHFSYTASHSHRLSASTNEKRKSLTVMARRTSGQSTLSTETSAPDQTTAHTEALAMVLKRMGFLASLPQFLLRELLADAAIVHHPSGHVVFHENETTSALVVILSGFVRVFSLENMGRTIDMFRGHPFCEFASLHHLLTKQQTSGSEDESPASAVPTLMRHRSAMYGVHIQTLHASNAFRAGILNDLTKCPATVVAQTPCEILVIDEAAYSQLLKKHTAPIDISRYELIVQHSPPPSEEPMEERNTVIADGKHRLVGKATPAALAKAIETSTPAKGTATWWATLSPIKRQFILRQSRLVTLQPGERLLHAGDVVDHLFVVVRGGLALYVTQHHERVAHALDASQRSVRSLMLERNVTSNYSTTSHQLNYASTDSRRLQHKRAMLKQKVNRMVTTSASSTSQGEAPGEDPSSSLFVHSVLAAVREEKRKSLTSPKTDAETVNAAVEASQRSATRAASPSKMAVTFHSAVTRATLQHRMDQRRSPAPPPVSRSNAADAAHSKSSTLLCILMPGDTYGEEALSHSLYRSPHSILADVSASATSTPSTPASFTSSMDLLAVQPPPPPPTAVELLCIHRKVFLDVQAKSDDELEQELRGRSKAVKSKWLAAEQSVLSARKASAGGSLTSAKTPKLFDLFKNILNQRYYLTMRAIADIPMLSDLPDAIKQELCIGARFEAVDRFANVYKDDIATKNEAPTAPAHRYYFVLNGRVGLFPKTAIHSNSSGVSESLASGSTRGSVSAPVPTSSHHHHHHQFAAVASNMEMCLRDVRVGHGFGEFEVLVPEASRHHILAIAIESSTLLSVPGELFVKCWPQLHEMQRHVDYLRHGVRFFQRLEMEKISYLYHGLHNESFSRNAKILEQQQPLAKSELLFLKDGECSVKTKVSVHAHANSDEDTADADTDSEDRKRQPHHVVRVLATIADVRGGHVFWLDSKHAPFTLQAISAHVSIARITVERLKMILPKSHMLQLEEHTEALAELYREQLVRARETIVRVMNDKRNAELGLSTDACVAPFLPSLHFSMQAASKKAQLQVRVGATPKPPRKAAGSIDATRAVGEPPAIPYSRVLASKPVDLAKLHADEKRMNTMIPDDSQDSNRASDGGQQASVVASNWDSELDRAYARDHEQEHYELIDGATTLPSAALLRGSFPDDVSLRRRHSRRPLRQASSSVAAVASPAAKEDEVAQAEAVLKSPRVQLRVTLPVAPRPLGSAGANRQQSRPTTPVAGASTKSGSAKAATFTVDYYGDEAATDPEEDDDGVEFVVDLRAMLRNELQSPLSPLRSISLIPSDCKVHSLGKYIDPPTLSPLREAQLHSPDSSGNGGLKDRKPRGFRGKAPPPGHSRSLPSPRQVTAAVIQKHGFLGVIAVPRDALVAGYARDEFLRSLVHRQRQRLIVLRDDCLLEYPPETMIVDLPKRDPLRCIRLTATRLETLHDSVGGEVEVVLRHSFLLSVQSNAEDHDSDCFLLTSESLVERKLWMEAIAMARAMGKPPVMVTLANQAENGAPGSPKFKHRESMALNLTQRENRRLSQLAGGRNGVTHADVLEVEYRIG